MAKKKKSRQGNTVNTTVSRATPDGFGFVGVPTIRLTTYQRTYRIDMLARQVKRYSMSVGTSAIQDVINFQLSDIPQASTFTGLYDQYRIQKVVVIFRSIGTTQNIGNSSGDVPTISTAIDYNDNAGSTPAEDYQSCVTTSMMTSFVRSFTPKTAMPVFNGVTSAYVQAPMLWIDCAYPAVPHYQLVVNVGTTSLDQQFVYSVDVLYMLEFKSVR